MKKQRSGFPLNGMNTEELITYLQEAKKKDASWNSGKMFGYVYFPETRIARVMKTVCDLYSHDNAINPTIFRSILHLENEIVEMVAHLSPRGHRSD